MSWTSFVLGAVSTAGAFWVVYSLALLVNWIQGRRDHRTDEKHLVAEIEYILQQEAQK